MIHNYISIIVLSSSPGEFATRRGRSWVRCGRLFIKNRSPSGPSGPHLRPNPKKMHIPHTPQRPPRIIRESC